MSVVTAPQVSTAFAPDLPSLRSPMNAGGLTPGTNVGTPVASVEGADVRFDVFVAVTATQYRVPFTSPLITNDGDAGFPTLREPVKGHESLGLTGSIPQWTSYCFRSDSTLAVHV